MATRLFPSILLVALAAAGLQAQTTDAARQPAKPVLVVPDGVFDGTGDGVQRGWAVLVRGQRIVSVGPLSQLDVPADAERVTLPGTTLLPGLSDLHSHVLLHPYDETVWNDQVLRESLALRMARAVNHLRNTLMAGFTVLRDLGTEGAGYADVGLKEAVEQGIVPGPRLFVATKAIVATGSYGPKGFGVEVDVPQGAEEADGVEGVTRVVRDQIGHGADWVKIYADYRWGPRGEARADVHRGRVAGHRADGHVKRTPGRCPFEHARGNAPGDHGWRGNDRARRRGNGGDVRAHEIYTTSRSARRWRPPSPPRAIADGRKVSIPTPTGITQKKAMFKLALGSGVTICNGSDVGVFTHGTNALELELMVEYGMTPVAALRAATSVNARILHRENDFGRVAPGCSPTWWPCHGDPTQDIKQLRACSS